MFPYEQAIQMHAHVAKVFLLQGFDFQHYPTQTGITAAIIAVAFILSIASIGELIGRYQKARARERDRAYISINELFELKRRLGAVEENAANARIDAADAIAKATAANAKTQDFVTQKSLDESDAELLKGIEEIVFRINGTDELSARMVILEEGVEVLGNNFGELLDTVAAQIPARRPRNKKK